LKNIGEEVLQSRDEFSREFVAKYLAAQRDRMIHMQLILDTRI